MEDLERTQEAVWNDDIPVDEADDIDGSLDESQLYEHFRIQVDKGQVPQRIDKFLFDRLPNVSRNRIQKAADAGYLIVAGRPVKSSYKVKPCDVISVMLDRPRYEYEIIPEDIPLDITYEDDAVLVVNKPAGMVVHPGHGNYTGTLVHALAWHFRDNPHCDVNDRHVGLVHRIDKDTSGLLVVAKTPEAKTILGHQFMQKTTHRSYRALVWGTFDEPEGRVETDIGRNVHDRLQMCVLPPGQGKLAITHYKVLETFSYVTWVECVLETGRTHQIRVHMKYLGHPLFADERYGGHTILRGLTSGSYKQFVNNCFKVCNRQALHAMTLGFDHPVTHEPMHFSAPLPDDMSSLLEKWRIYTTQHT